MTHITKAQAITMNFISGQGYFLERNRNGGVWFWRPGSWKPRPPPKESLFTSRGERENEYPSAIDCFVPIKFICVNVIPKVLRLEPSSWSLCPYKRSSRELPCPFCHVKTQAICEPVNQDSGSHQTLNLPVLWSWTSQPLELWQKCLCCLWATQFLVFCTAAQTG